MSSVRESLEEKRRKKFRKRAVATCRGVSFYSEWLGGEKIFEIYFHEVGRLNQEVKEVVKLNALNEFQQRAHDEIVQSFQEKNVCLLHGVTSSGKTEVYIHLIEETIRQGKQVLYLLPEIALTTQITERLQRVFGSRLGIYHSKFPDAERVEIWRKQLGEKDMISSLESVLPYFFLSVIWGW